MRKRSKKFLSLCLALVMALGALTVPASACTADKDGNITPCEKVEEDGYCDIEWLRGIDWEAGIMYQWPNPYYKANKTPGNSSSMGGVWGSVGGGTTEIGDDTQVIPDRPKNPIPEETETSTSQPAEIETFDFKNVPTEGSILAEACYTMFEDVMPKYGFDAFSYGPENWTIHTDEYDAVFDLDTFIGTLTYTDGHIETRQSTVQKPAYWKTNDGVVETATGKLVADTDGRPIKYFPDVDESAWYFEAVTTLATNGILNGYPDGSFHPEDNVTTGELCAIIYRLGKNENPVNKPVPDHPEYTHWASYAVWALNNRNFGYTTCDPSAAAEFANRGEAVTAIMALIEDDNGAHRLDRDYARILNWTYDDNNIPDWNKIAPNRDLNGIPDYSQMDSNHRWSPTYVLDAYNYSIINGVDNTGRFNPSGTLTRAELAQMLYNAKLTKYTPAPMREQGSTQGIVVGG